MCLCFITKLERICRCIFDNDLLQLHSVCLLWQGRCWKFQTCLSAAARQAGSPLKGDHNNTMHHLLTFMMQGSHLLTMFLPKLPSLAKRVSKLLAIVEIIVIALLAIRLIVPCGLCLYSSSELVAEAHAIKDILLETPQVSDIDSL